MVIAEKKEQETASVRFRTALAALPQEIGKVYAEVVGSLARQGIQPAGPPFALYYNMDMEDMDVEAGFPVASRCAADGRVGPGRLPGGRTATELHRGPYSTVSETYGALSVFIGSKGAVPSGLCYESYLNDPETTAPAELLTEVNYVLKE